jgi:hypothetical protein
MAKKKYQTPKVSELKSAAGINVKA